MEQLIDKQFQTLIDEFTPLIHKYKIPKTHAANFENFNKEYKFNKSKFFRDIDNIETSILDIYKSRFNNIKHEQKNSYLSDTEISDFLEGKILKKTILSTEDLDKLKTEIHNLLNLDNPLISRKFLHLLSPEIINFIFKHKSTLFGSIEALLGNKENISFELGYFRTPPGMSNHYWHDDYTLFRNKVLKSDQHKGLILNLHLALSNVRKDSSPVCFLRGTENLVYARAALKYFYSNNIKIDEELLLKATFLTEELYSPGKKVKTNFIGLLPCYKYRLFQLQKLQKKFEIFFHEVNYGDFLIFSPHYMHTSPFINQDKVARESIVFRFLSDDYYNLRNVVTCKTLIKYLSFAKGRKIKFQEIKSALFYNYPDIHLNSKIYFNIYLNKKVGKVNNSSYPRIYFEDIHQFFNNGK
jgi:ectoine hydroxylase-related dioxygenase (phytanoyl-CoA dioxygenase family)